MDALESWAFWICLKSTVEVNDPGTNVTGFSLGVNTWHNLLAEYSPGAGQMSISVDSGTPEVYGCNSIADVALITFSGGGDRWFIDDVPEPATLVVLLAGGLLAVFRRRS